MLANEKKFSIEELLATEATRWDRRIASDLAAELETQLAEKLETIPEIRRLLAVKGYRELRARLDRDIGSATGSDAIRAMALALRAFAHERPGLSAEATLFLRRNRNVFTEISRFISPTVRISDSQIVAVSSFDLSVPAFARKESMSERTSRVCSASPRPTVLSAVNPAR